MPAPGEDNPATAPTATRIVVLALVAFVTAVLVQFAIIGAGVDRDNPFRLFVTPLIAAVIVYFGLRGYPGWGRVRLAALVGFFVLLFSGAS